MYMYPAAEMQYTYAGKYVFFQKMQTPRIGQ